LLKATLRNRKAFQQAEELFERAEARTTQLSGFYRPCRLLFATNNLREFAFHGMEDMIQASPTEIGNREGKCLQCLQRRLTNRAKFEHEGA
jgi:hypothetical protein